MSKIPPSQSLFRSFISSCLIFFKLRESDKSLIERLTLATQKFDIERLNDNYATILTLKASDHVIVQGGRLQKVAQRPTDKKRAEAESCILKTYQDSAKWLTPFSHPPMTREEALQKINRLHDHMHQQFSSLLPNSDPEAPLSRYLRGQEPQEADRSKRQALEEKVATLSQQQLVVRPVPQAGLNPAQLVQKRGGGFISCVQTSGR